MPRKLSPKKRCFVPSFKQVVKPLTYILPTTPRLYSRGNRPLQMTFEDQLNALIFFHLEEDTSARLLFGPYRKTTLPVIILPLRTVLAEVHSQKPLMSVALSNFCMFFNNCRSKPAHFCLKNTPLLAIWSQLTVHSLTLFCLWAGPITARGPKRPDFILVLM